MKFINDLSIQEAIELYFEKHDAIRRADMTKLMELKNKCADIFTQKNDDDIRKVIEYAKAFQKTEKYKNLRRLDLKKQLKIVNTEAKK